MLTLELTSRGASPEKIDIEHGCTIGKAATCDIVIKGLLVGKIQARIVCENKAYYLEDSGGIAATLVNGSPITRYGPLAESDQIEIGMATLKVLRARVSSRPQPVVADIPHGTVDAPAHSTPAAVPPVTLNRDAKADTHAPAKQPAPSIEITRLPASAQEPEQALEREPAVAALFTPKPVPRPVVAPIEIAPINSEAGINLRKLAHMRVIAALDLRRLNVARMEDSELRRTVGGVLDEILGQDPVFSNPAIPLAALRKAVFDEIIGLGPLEELIADPSISEIMVNCHDEIFIEQHGRLGRSPVIFTDSRAVLGAIERIVAPIGRRIDESSPMVDARLADGSRVNAVIPPLALKGPSITIRKFSQRRLNGPDLVQFGSMSPDMLEFLQTAVEQRANIVISGGTGSGKTTLLNVLSSYIPDDERIVTVEDAAELQLYQPNLVALEARPPNMEGKGAIGIRDLVKNCLRMRPDRIVVGECRGGEALDMLQAMNTGHDGSLTTAHSNSPRDCIARLEVMTLMAGLDLPVQAIREQICSAVDIIVQQTRFSCGSRRVTHITEVGGMETGVIQLQDVFVFKQEGFDEHGKVQGQFLSTSYIPDFYQDLLRRRIHVNTDIFTNAS